MGCRSPDAFVVCSYVLAVSPAPPPVPVSALPPFGTLTFAVSDVPPTPPSPEIEPPLLVVVLTVGFTPALPAVFVGKARHTPFTQ